jgi:hypothetical protein
MLTFSVRVTLEFTDQRKKSRTTFVLSESSTKSNSFPDFSHNSISPSHCNLLLPFDPTTESISPHFVKKPKAMNITLIASDIKLLQTVSPKRMFFLFFNSKCTFTKYAIISKHYTCSNTTSESICIDEIYWQFQKKYSRILE